MPAHPIQFLSLMHLFFTQLSILGDISCFASETDSGKSLAFQMQHRSQVDRTSVATTPLPKTGAYLFGNGMPNTIVTGQGSDDRQGGRRLRMYGSNNHLAGFLKLILNKHLFPSMILIWHNGHDWPAVDEQLDGLIAVAHGKEY